MQQYGATNDLTVQLAGPFGSVGSAAKLLQLTLYRDRWKGAVSPFTQVVEAEGISVNSRVDLLPDAAQLEMLGSWGIALMAENEDGTVTVCAVGGCPAEDCILQAAAVEVVA